MEWLKDLVSEQSSVSTTRVMSLGVTVCACVLAFLHADTTMVLGMLGIAFGAKVGQKIIE